MKLLMNGIYILSLYKFLHFGILQAIWKSWWNFQLWRKKFYFDEVAPKFVKKIKKKKKIIFGKFRHIKNCKLWASFSPTRHFPQKFRRKYLRSKTNELGKPTRWYKKSHYWNFGLKSHDQSQRFVKVIKKKILQKKKKKKKGNNSHGKFHFWGFGYSQFSGWINCWSNFTQLEGKKKKYIELKKKISAPLICGPQRILCGAHRGRSPGKSPGISTYHFFARAQVE